MDASDTYTHELNSENKYSNILIILFSTCRRWKTFIITFLQYVELSQNYATYDWKAMKGIFHRTHYYLNAFIGQPICILQPVCFMIMLLSSVKWNTWKVIWNFSISSKFWQHFSDRVYDSLIICTFWWFDIQLTDNNFGEQCKGAAG